MNINIISEPVEPSAFWVTDIIDGIMKESMKKALNVSATTDGEVPNEFPSTDDSPRVIALVVGYSLPWIERTLSALRAAGAEPILVSVYQYSFRSNYSYVAFNTAEAMSTLVDYLFSAGRRRIALFGVHKDTVGDVAKVRGFIQGTRANGARTSGSDIYARGIMAECAAKLWENIKSYDAVVCTSDLLAVYLTLYLQSRGISVPDDLFVTGFGNWSSLEFFRPGITRMYTDLNELGCQAVRLHQFLQYNSKARYSSVKLECMLQIRESTEALPFTGRSLAGRDPDTVESAPKSPVYYSDPDIMSVLKAELYIRNTDAVDHAIIAGVRAGTRYQDISERLNVSEATIKYRLGKMLKSVGFGDKQELFAFLDRFNLFI